MTVSALSFVIPDLIERRAVPRTAQPCPGDMATVQWDLTSFAAAGQPRPALRKLRDPAA